jgi:hypothetical protein
MELESPRGPEKGAASAPSTTGRLVPSRPADDRLSATSRTLFPEIEKLLARAAGH